MECVSWKGQSVGFQPSGSSVFCLPWAEKIPSAPAYLTPERTPGPPRKHQKNGCLIGAPPCGYCSDDCHLLPERNTCAGWRGWREGACGAPGLLPLSAPGLLSSGSHASAWVTAPSSSSPIPSSNLPAQGVIPCSLIQDIILARGFGLFL